MYMGVSGRGVRDIPSRMFAAQVSCDGCHTHVVSTTEPGALAIGEKSLKAERESCVVCHGEGFDAMLDDWLKVMHKEVDEFRPKLEAAEATLKRYKKGGRDLGEAETLMADARYNFEMVNFGKGVHNVEYAVSLLKAASDQIDVAMKYLDENAKPISRDRLLGTPDGYCSILCHERVGVPEEIHFTEMKHDFPHQMHVEDVGIECTVCHSPEKHKMRIISREQCMNCHHREEQIDCRHCHNEQDTVFRGMAEGFDLDEDIPGVMSEAVECTDCHDLEAAAPSLTAMREKCVECHDDESYGDMLVEWEQESQKSLDDFAVLLAQARASLDRVKHTASNIEKLEATFEEAKRMGETIETGNPVHNIEYADAMLAAAEQKLQSIIEQTKP